MVTVVDRLRSLSEATDGFDPSRPGSRGWRRGRGPAVCDKGQINWIEGFSDFIESGVATCFRRVESLFPSFELLGGDVVMPGAIDQNAGPNERDNDNRAERTKENVSVIPILS